MSKEQWGHGFYKGYEAGEKGAKKEKYVCSIASDGHLLNAYMILEKHGKVYTVESLSDLISEVVAFGHLRSFSEDENNIDIDRVTEISIDELSKFNKPIMFYSQAAFRSWIENDFKRFMMEVEHADKCC